MKLPFQCCFAQNEIGIIESVFYFSASSLRVIQPSQSLSRFKNNKTSYSFTEYAFMNVFSFSFFKNFLFRVTDKIH